MRRLRRIFVFMIVVSMVAALAPVVLADEGGKININTATVEQLMQLQKVGKSYAERIVAYREQNGPFQKPEDILKVKGVGTKTFELNKDRITVE